MQICRTHETAKQQREEIKGGHQTIAGTSSYKSKKQQDRQSNYGQVKVPPTQKCSRCGKPQHKIATNCAALNKVCNKCHEIGHFATQCRTKSLRRN